MAFQNIYLKYAIDQSTQLKCKLLVLVNITHQLPIATHQVSKAQSTRAPFVKIHLKITTQFNYKLTENIHVLIATIPKINQKNLPSRRKSAKSLVDKKTRMSCRYL